MMSPPTPPIPLKNHCSTIYNNTLFVFQPDAFQALSLEDGAKWAKLPMGISTSGSVCVQGSPNGQDSLFIVGGVTNPTLHGYLGVQRYIFKTKKWETIKPGDTVAQNRQGHGSVYLNTSSSILIYAGYQDNKEALSSQTFTISMVPPYNIHSYTSTAPPLLRPLLMPWNASHALMVGGNQANKNLFTFGPAPGERWQPLDKQLQEGLKDSSKVQTAIIDGTDGSKVLQIFDMSVSPNSVSVRELRNGTDNVDSKKSSARPTPPSSMEPQKPSRKRKREITPDRPVYNSTLASQTQRFKFSLAQDQNGFVVISGGQPEETDEVLSLFNQTKNQWIDPVQFFAQDTILGNPTSEPTPATPPATSTGRPTLPSTPSTDASGGGGDGGRGSKNRSLTILGATLGAIFGLAAVLIVLLLLLRCFRRRRETNHKRKTSDYPLDNKHGMDFADQGVNHMQETGGSVRGNASHKHTGSGNTTTSMAIMSGSARAGSSQSKRGFLHRTGDSNGSSKSFFSRAKSPLAPSPPPISGPIPINNPRDNHVNVQASPEPRTEPRTDTGWSRYFTNDSATNLASVHPGNPHHDSTSRPTTYASGSQSDYTSSRIESSNLHESAEVQPLSVRSGAPHPPNTRLMSPTSGVPLALQPGVALSAGAHDSNPPSPSTLVSDVDEEHEYRPRGDRSHESEGMASWTPIAASDRGSTWEDRPISSVYADSVIYPHPGERVRIPNFPRVPSTRASTARNSQVDPSIDSRGLRSMASRDLRTPPSRDQERELPEVGSRRAGPPIRDDDRDGEDPRRRGPDAEDMSWLNLGR